MSLNDAPRFNSDDNPVLCDSGPETWEQFKERFAPELTKALAQVMADQEPHKMFSREYHEIADAISELIGNSNVLADAEDMAMEIVHRARVAQAAE